MSAAAAAPTLFPTNLSTPSPPAVSPTSTGAGSRPYRANVLLYPDLFEGDTRNNYNNTTLIWTGVVSPAGGHVQTRLLGRGDGIMVFIQVFYPRAEGTVVLEINGRTFPAAFASSPHWRWGTRCGGSCRGWIAGRLIRWDEVGGMPQVGDKWPLRQAAFGHEWAGLLHWGLPDYAAEPLTPTLTPALTPAVTPAVTPAGSHAELLTLPLTADAPVGGNSNCGSDDWPDYFPTWGLRNTDGQAVYLEWKELGAISQASIAQNQTDVADWPCYARYFARFALDGLPPGAQVTSATVEVRHFGNAGYGAGYAENGAQDTIVQIYEVDAWWDEMGITWDNAPIPRENTGRITIIPIDVACPIVWPCSVPYFLDVTEIVRRAQAAGRPWASFATYTGSGDYHSGKYIWTREGATQAPVVRILYRRPDAATPTPMPTPDSPQPDFPTEMPTEAPTVTASLTPAATFSATPPTILTATIPVTLAATATITPSATAEESPAPPQLPPGQSIGLYLPELGK